MGLIHRLQWSILSTVNYRSCDMSIHSSKRKTVRALFDHQSQLCSKAEWFRSALRCLIKRLNWLRRSLQKNSSFQYIRAVSVCSSSGSQDVAISVLYMKRKWRETVPAFTRWVKLHNSWMNQQACFSAPTEKIKDRLLPLLSGGSNDPLLLRLGYLLGPLGSLLLLDRLLVLPLLVFVLMLFSSWRALVKYALVDLAAL